MAMTQVAPAREPGRFSPIFVLAPARSYSSVVSMMLGQHPDLVGLPELKLFAYPTVGELEASLPRFWFERGVMHRSPGLVRTVAEVVFGDQSIGSLNQARNWLEERYSWSGADLLDFLMKPLLPRRCVEKSPENVETDPALARLAAAYPQARYLHLVRHPVTTQRSIEAHLESMLPGRGRAGQPMSGIAAWFVTHQRILRFAATLPNDRYLRVRAEDVLNDTSAHLHAIAVWLRLCSDAPAIEAMKHPERSPFAGPGPTNSGVVGGNDPAFLRDPNPRSVSLPKTIDMPPGWSESPATWHLVTKLAARLGYV
jgi:hypothetical protein